MCNNKNHQNFRSKNESIISMDVALTNSVKKIFFVCFRL